jgi:hypothetical protein
MQRALFWLAPYETGLPTVFDEYLKQVQDLPITSERLSWDRNILQEKDKLLEAASQRFRDRVFEECWALIDRFAQADRAARE